MTAAPVEHAVTTRRLVLRDEEVRAVLAGQKTQFRSVVMLRHPWGFIGGRGEEADPSCWGYAVEDEWMVLARGLDGHRVSHGHTSIPCPYGDAGDRLWVAETWADADCMYQSHINDSPSTVAYRADKSAILHNANKPTKVPQIDIANWNWSRLGWQSSARMPRWASRLTLKILAVRVERLHEISEADAWAEGLETFDGALDEASIVRHAVEMRLCVDDPRPSFAALWELLRGKRSPWSANPWVWVVEFRVAQ